MRERGYDLRQYLAFCCLSKLTRDLLVPFLAENLKLLDAKIRPNSPLPHFCFASFGYGVCRHALS